MRASFAHHRLGHGQGLGDHRPQLANVVGLVRHIGGEDDLAGRHHRLGVVALEVTLAALHDPAVGIGHVGLGLLVDHRLGRLRLAAPLAFAGRFLLGCAGVATRDAQRNDGLRIADRPQAPVEPAVAAGGMEVAR